MPSIERVAIDALNLRLIGLNPTLTLVAHSHPRPISRSLGKMRTPVKGKTRQQVNSPPFSPFRASVHCVGRRRSRRGTASGARRTPWRPGSTIARHAGRRPTRRPCGPSLSPRTRADGWRGEVARVKEDVLGHRHPADRDFSVTPGCVHVRARASARNEPSASSPNKAWSRRTDRARCPRRRPAGRSASRRSHRRRSGSACSRRTWR